MGKLARRSWKRSAASCAFDSLLRMRLFERPGRLLGWKPTAWLGSWKRQVSLSVPLNLTLGKNMWWTSLWAPRFGLLDPLRRLVPPWKRDTVETSLAIRIKANNQHVRLSPVGTPPGGWCPLGCNLNPKMGSVLRHAQYPHTHNS